MLKSPYRSVCQRSDCDAIGRCAGYTETRWTSLDGCGWENSFSVSRVPSPEYDFDPVPTPTAEEAALLGEAIRLGEAILLGEAIRVGESNSSSTPLTDTDGVEVAGFLSADDTSEMPPPLSEEVLQISKSVSRQSVPSEMAHDVAPHEKKLMDVTVEYLQ